MPKPFSFVRSCRILLCMFIGFATHASIGLAHASALEQFSELDNAGLLVVHTDGTELMNKRADDAFIPASTTKIVTGFLALEHWGENHQFVTHFYFDDNTQTLWVKGSGDPFLVSEELATIAGQLSERLKANGVNAIQRIGLDISLFADNLVLPGTSNTNNPYDAVPSALAANFNTVYLRKMNGNIVSAEPQTPLTSFAKTLAARPKNTFKRGKLRVNTGRKPQEAARYFGELLGEFLNQMALPSASTLVIATVPKQLVDTNTPIYSHANSKTVGEMIKPMMKYSTNFIANQLILMLAAESVTTVANAEHVRRTLKTKLDASLAASGWADAVFIEGAGLSRDNQVSPRQLVALLEKFRPYKHLLPEVEPGVFAKSGTLSGVSTLAGYLVIDGEWHSFALMMNQSVPYKLRNRIARELRNSL